MKVQMGQRLLSAFQSIGRSKPSFLVRHTQRVLAQVERQGRMNHPLILISQVSRSGGTLLSQLFDHHPEIWAHPHELKVGYPKKWNWPQLTSQEPTDVFRLLEEPRFAQGFSTSAGYQKGSDSFLPIQFDGDLQRELFLRLAEIEVPSRQRDWLDLYFTSFFYAWLDYQNRYAPKTFVTGFASMLSMDQTSMTQFRSDYPEGWLLSIVREPLGWYASQKGRVLKRPELRREVKLNDKQIYLYGSFEEAEDLYLSNLAAFQRNALEFSNQFIGVGYDDLIHQRELTMRYIADTIGLSWNKVLCEQTFNGMAIRPNTSFEAPGERKSILTDEEVERITKGPMTQNYQETLQHTALKDGQGINI
jgi:hypothetical protein